MNSSSRSPKSDFDRNRGVDTDGTIRLSEFAIEHENARYGMSYQPTDPAVIHRAMLFFGDNPTELDFFDLGSGKGRILIGAAEQGFRTVIGVEFVPELVAIARNNIRKLGLKNVSITQGDAGKFIFPGGNMFIYLGNPFRTQVMQQVVSNLAASSYQKAYVVYRVPRCASTLDDAVFLEPLGDLPGSYGRKLVTV